MKARTRLTILWGLLLLITSEVTALATYNPQTGRWLSRDPLDEKGGQNLFALAKNNPVGEFDILGLLDSADAWQQYIQLQLQYQALLSLQGKPCCKRLCNITLDAMHDSITYSTSPPPKTFDANGHAYLKSKRGDCDYTATVQSWWSCCYFGGFNGGQPASGPLYGSGLYFNCPCDATVTVRNGNRHQAGSNCRWKVRMFYLSCEGRTWQLKSAEVAGNYQADYDANTVWFNYNGFIQVYPP